MAYCKAWILFIIVALRRINQKEPIPFAIVKSIDQHYLIEVRDNGIGFEQKDGDRISNVLAQLYGNAQ
jgi:hypothetical protein